MGVKKLALPVVTGSTTHMISKKSSLKDLIERSPYHSWWGDDEYELYVALPISLGQCLVLDDGFISWGFPDSDAAKKYLATKRFEPEWFDGGGNDLWVVDFICLDEKVLSVVRDLRRMLFGIGYTRAYWLRTESGKLGWISI